MLKCEGEVQREVIYRKGKTAFNLTTHEANGNFVFVKPEAGTMIFTVYLKVTTGG